MCGVGPLAGAFRSSQPAALQSRTKDTRKEIDTTSVFGRLKCCSATEDEGHPQGAPLPAAPPLSLHTFVSDT